MIKTRPNGQHPFIDTLQECVDDIEEALMPVARDLLGDEAVDEIIDRVTRGMAPVDINYIELK